MRQLDDDSDEPDLAEHRGPKNACWISTYRSPNHRGASVWSSHASTIWFLQGVQERARGRAGLSRARLRIGEGAETRQLQPTRVLERRRLRCDRSGADPVLTVLVGAKHNVDFTGSRTSAKGAVNLTILALEGRGLLRYRREGVARSELMPNSGMFYSVTVTAPSAPSQGGAGRPVGARGVELPALASAGLSFGASTISSPSAGWRRQHACRAPSRAPWVDRPGTATSISKRSGWRWRIGRARRHERDPCPHHTR